MPIKKGYKYPRHYRIEYALYKGENLQFIGTADEIAEYRGVTVNCVYHWGRPSYMRRLEARGAKNATIAVNLGRCEE